MLKNVIFYISVFILWVCNYSNLYSQEGYVRLNTGIDSMHHGVVRWGDYDKDNDFDLLISGFYESDFQTVLYKNNDGNFTKLVTNFEGTGYGNCMWGDIDNDGDLDLLISGWTWEINDSIRSTAAIYLNNMDDTFERLQIDLHINPESNWTDYTASWADMDNDGDLDIVICSINSLTVFRNDGNLSFVKIENVFNPNIREASFAWGDYDNDQDLDVLICGQVIDNTELVPITRLFRNDGDFSFNVAMELPGITWNGRSNITFGDQENDGDLDIFMCGLTEGGTGIARIFRNEGTDNFIEQSYPNIYPARQGACPVGDHNGDGYLDWLISGFIGGENYIRVYEYDNGSYNLNDYGLPIHIGEMQWCDFDKDLDLDITSIGRNNELVGSVELLENRIPSNNKKPKTPEGLQSHVSNKSVTLKWSPSYRWNGITQVYEESKSLSYSVFVGKFFGGVEVVSPNAILSNGELTTRQHLGNAQLDTTFLLRNLEPGTYYWGVQCIDNAMNSSPFSEISSFTIMDSTLVAFFPFNGNANDESGFNNNGTVTNATLATDRFGNSNQAYNFDGNEDQIEISHNTNLSLTNFTISVWINLDSADAHNEDDSPVILSKSGNFNLRVFTDDYLGVYGSFNREGGVSTIFDKEPIAFNKWYHIALSYDTINHQLKYYRNGRVISIEQIGYIPETNTQSLIIGNKNLGDPSDFIPFNGQIDDIRIYNRVLTEEQISELYLENNFTPEIEDSKLQLNNHSDSSITVKWNPVPGSVQYYLKSTIGGQIDSVLSIDTIYTLNDLNSGNQVKFQLKSIGASFETDWSAPLELGTSSWINEKLIAYYPFSGNTIDQSINTNNARSFFATLTNDRFGIPNSAYYFDGMSDYIYRDHNMNFNSDLSFSFSAWIKPESGCKGIIFSLGPYRATINLILNNFELYLSGGHELKTFFDANDNWSHVAFVHSKDSSIVKTYINGIKNGEINYSEDYSISYNELQIGGQLENYFKGKIDELRFYERELSDEEIYSLYDNNFGNHRPSAVFKVTPSIGSIDTIFRFDASLSSDLEDSKDLLKVRWDFNNDDNFETSWSTVKTATKKYSAIGDYQVKLEVQDSQGAIDDTVITISVRNNSVELTTHFYDAYLENRIAGRLDIYRNNQLEISHNIASTTTVDYKGANNDVKPIFPGDYVFKAISESYGVTSRNVHIEEGVNPYIKFKLGHIADYDFDSDIDFDDLLLFMRAWDGYLDSLEIGPVTGSLPNATVIPDGKTDFEDLMVFAQMWEIKNASTDQPIVHKAKNNHIKTDDFKLSITKETDNYIQYSLKYIGHKKITALQIIAEYNRYGLEFNSENQTVGKGIFLIKEDKINGAIEFNYASLNKENNVEFNFIFTKQSTHNSHPDFSYTFVSSGYEVKKGFLLKPETPDSEKILVYPNPVNSAEITLDIKKWQENSPNEIKSYNIQIFNITGELEIGKNFEVAKTMNNLKLNVSDLNPGYYILRISSNNYLKEIGIVIHE